MLPRLRFVFAAALIAAFPWILLGSGVVTTAQNTPVSEIARAGTGVAVSAGDLRDAQHMHALAFVRRSRELERLRELANAPLSDWIATPAGLPAPDAVATDEHPGERDAAPAPLLAPPAEPAPEPQITASLPAPATAAEPTVASPGATEQEPIDQSVTATPVATEDAPQAATDVEPDLSHTDWSKVVPPLPRARTDEEHRNAAVRRIRTKRSVFAARSRQLQPSPFATQPNPFGGPPATATTHNPGRSGVTQY